MFKFRTIVVLWLISNLTTLWLLLFALLIEVLRCYCQLLSHVQLFVTPQTVGYQTPLLWNSPGKNTGVDCYSLLQGIFPTQGSILGLPHSRQILIHLSHQVFLIATKLPSTMYMYTYKYICICTIAVVQSLSHVQLFVTPWTPGLSLLHHLQKFAQIHVHGIGDAIQPSHPLSPSSPPAFNLSQHQGLFQ